MNQESAADPKVLEIMIVDDDKILTLLHQKQLRGQTHPVSVHFNGKTALEFIDANPSFNFLVLLDIHMPLMNGWEFLETINNRDMGKNIKVVMISSSITDADKSRALTYAQVIEYFVKPVTAGDILRLMEHRELRGYFDAVEFFAPMDALVEN